MDQAPQSIKPFKCKWNTNSNSTQIKVKTIKLKSTSKAGKSIYHYR